MERKHSAVIETLLECHKCPGLSSNLGGWAGPELTDLTATGLELWVIQNMVRFSNSGDFLRDLRV